MKLKHFIYVDNKSRQLIGHVDDVVFDCFASSIIEADAIAKNEKGIDLKREPTIGCLMFESTGGDLELRQSLSLNSSRL